MTKLCPRGKAAAKRKFKVYPSAYANAYASKICAGKALMNRRDKANQMKEFLATEGGDISMPMGPFITRKRKMDMNPAMFLSGVGDDPVIPGIQAGAKKGGRIMKTKKGGKAVRGFAKKKKQANKMRKK